MLSQIVSLYLMFILGATKIRKNFGWLMQGIIALCIVCMLSINEFLHLIEGMYSWALFFVTVQVLFIFGNNK